MLPPPSLASSFWQTEHLRGHLRNVRETLSLSEALRRELDTILQIRTLGGGHDAPVARCSGEDHVIRRFSEAVGARGVGLNLQESLSLEAANSVIRTLRDQLAPLSVIASQTAPWEERSAASRLAQKLQKYKRNKGWRKKKIRRIAERLCKERKMFEKADQDADEWRAREIANDIARRKVENMKAIAKLKANEERNRLESELELVLVVEKLQELRSIRIQKLKKQGHFLPEEDDKFLERVRAAVEEEERQSAAAADTDAAKDAIATAEESRKIIHSTGNDARDENYNKSEATTSHDQSNVKENERNSGAGIHMESERRELEGQGCGGNYDSVANLPFEFYHYYHGSNNDMGTLIEVRRTWDAYIKHTGSRIPGHWVQPPPPANEVWASYLVGPKSGVVRPTNYL